MSLSSFALLSTSPCSSAIINHAATRSFFLSSSIPSSTVKQQQQHIAAAASRAGCLCCPPTTKSSKTTPPHIYQQTRSFDRPRYFAEKRRLKALNDKENVTMEEALQVFRVNEIEREERESYIQSRFDCYNPSLFYYYYYLRSIVWVSHVQFKRTFN